MKVLVYGAGVIGGQICHALFSCGNDVTVVARGDWAKTLRHDGLRIRHYIQRKDTVDRPRVLESPNDTRYDAAFAAMQDRQSEAEIWNEAGEEWREYRLRWCGKQ